MLEFVYWLSAVYKALALLSLIIFVSEKKFKTEITKGFLWLYLNEIVLFFVSFYVEYLFSERKF